MSHNNLQGVIPTWASLATVDDWFLSHTQLAGSIPQELFHQHRSHLNFIASEVAHEGSIPFSFSRLDSRSVNVALGHGLRGLLPRIPGTVFLLSLWENGLQGHLPDLHIHVGSNLLVHANDFSCKLPMHGGIEPYVSLGLIGNHFTQPGQHPPWIK
eukprot:5115957-Amphidinium_carterae.1